MIPRITIGLGLLAAAAACLPRIALAAPVLISTDYRYAAQADKTLARAGGTVSESKRLPRGLHLAAPSAQEQGGEAVATAIYRFKVALAAKSLTIEVGYRLDPAAKDKEVAGLLFVRNLAMEQKAAEADDPTKRLEEEPAFFGNLYFLKADDSTTSIVLPAENHVADGVLEIHLSAGAGQAFDAQYVQVAAHRAVAAYSRGRGAGSSYASDPLRQQPPPQLIHGVPNLYPNLYGAGHATSQDPIFWHQLWLQQYPHSAYQYPYLYCPGRRHEPHKHKK